MTVIPDFMIIGAPKCGTTSLAGWLGLHPKVFLADPKEPAHFSSDINTVGAIRDEQAYGKLFADALGTHLSGEASTMYLRSRVAVPNILKARGDTKFIVCLRNPIEMMPSVHMQLLQGGREAILEPAEAWAARLDRRKDERLPGFCPEPADLDYEAACKLGEQVERLLDHAPRDQVHFVFSEDMRQDPRSSYGGVLEFLGLEDDGRYDFATFNVRKAPRSPRLARLIATASELRRKAVPSQKLSGLGSKIARLNRQSVQPPRAMSDELRTELAAAFAEDIHLLGHLTDRDLSSWLAL